MQPFLLCYRLLVIRMHNLHGTEKEKQEEESSDDESDDDEEDQDKKPQMELAMLPHYGGINRVRVCCISDIRYFLMRIQVFLCKFSIHRS